MTSYSKGLPVSWNKGVKGGRGGKERAPLGGRAHLGRGVPLGRKVAF